MNKVPFCIFLCFFCLSSHAVVNCYDYTNNNECITNHYCIFENGKCTPNCTNIPTNQNNNELCESYTGCSITSDNEFDDVSCDLCIDGSYCPGDMEPQQCPSPFSASAPGTASIDDCYAPCASSSDNYEQHTQHCGMTYRNFGTHNISCLINGQLTSDTIDPWYHIEITSDNIFGCYLNDRECNRFNAIDHDGNGLIADNMQGEAVWDANHNNGAGGYDISACRYKTTNETLHNCIATIYYHPYNMQYVATAQDSIKFYTGDGNSGDVSNQDYYCTVCKDGPYYPVSVTNIATCADPNDFESSGTTYYQACKCEKIHQGYYYSASTQWTYASQVGQPNSYYTACPAGKTTLNDIGGTSSVDCTYTRDTKFCDANGCFKITDADSWNWSD